MSRVALLGFGIWALGFASLLAQMPDPALMHGRAIPAADLPAGTVTVRIVREALTNNIVGQDVRVIIGGTTSTAQTDAQGRAEFPNLPQGSEARAEAVVDGEQLVSEPFTVPSSGGLRLILVAGLKTAAAPVGPAAKGTVVIGPNSRVLMEFRDDALQMFYVLDILNNASSPVDIGGPLIVDLPTGAAGATVLQGSSPAASVSGDRLTITGPFAPGLTSVQVAFQLLYDQADVTVQQTWPAALEQLTVAVEKVGSVSISSPQFSTVGEIKSDNGTPFLLASGPALPAGATLTLQLSNLPVHSRTSRSVALGLALAIVGIGFWLAFTRRPAMQDVRRRLIQRRDTLLGELAALERRARKGGAPDEARRQQLLAELEQIYGELDDVGGGPQGGGKDVAA